MATISCHHARAALHGALNQGHDRSRLLKLAGINPQLADIEFARVNEKQMTRLVQLIWETLGDEFMGFTQSPCKTGAFAFMLNSIRRCETLREALRQGTQFYNLLTDDIQTQLIETDTEARIDIVFKNPEKDPQHFYLEFWMIIWHRLASWITDTKIALLQTRFAHARPAHAEELRHMFPGEQQFDAPANSLIFSREALNAPPLRTELQIRTFLQRSPFDLLTIPGIDKSLQNAVRQHLTDRISEPMKFPAIESLARDFNLTAATLHRRLKKEGSSYQAIKDEIRRDTALTKLVRDRLSVQRVAEIVGFSEARSFTRAFKLWTGLSPREYCRYLTRQ